MNKIRKGQILVAGKRRCCRAGPLHQSNVRNRCVTQKAATSVPVHAQLPIATDPNWRPASEESTRRRKKSGNTAFRQTNFGVYWTKIVILGRY
jgi:hypothetical protein